MRKPFKTVRANEVLGGVCGGLAYSLGLPTLWVRMAFVLLVILGNNSHVAHVGNFIWIFYVLVWILAPKWENDPEDYEERTA